MSYLLNVIDVKNRVVSSSKNITSYKDFQAFIGELLFTVCKSSMVLTSSCIDKYLNSNNYYCFLDYLDEVIKDKSYLASIELDKQSYKIIPVMESD